VCRFCGATDAIVDGNKFTWIGKDRTCCSRYSCQTQDQAEKRKKARKPRSEFAGWGPGAVFEELDKRREAKRRKRAKK
jgi:hypothetical protein